MKDNQWILTVNAFEEEFGEDGLPVDLNYIDVNFIFDTLVDATNFINLFQEASTQFHKFTLEQL